MMRLIHTSYVSIICVAFVSSEPPKNLRTTELAQQQLQSASIKREHVIRRLYGEDNALVRKEMNKIELRMSRYTTGFNADLNHIVPYENHPYDRTTRQRRLEEEQKTNVTETQVTATYKPMRIRFETKALDDIRNSSNAAKIDWFKTEILPVTADFWSSALSVVPISGNLRISSGELDSFTYCGDPEFTEVPNEHKSTGLEDTDLILYVSGSASERFCPERTLAVAVPCNFDQFDRPTAGAINVCLNGIVLNSDGTSSPDVAQDYVDVTIHEVAHVLGHSSNSYRFYWDSETGTERTARPFTETTVTCVDGVERTLVLPDTNTMEIGIDDRGRRFATIVTPKVRAVARNQFNCQTLTGANLENQPTRADSCVGDHWDERLFYPEALSGVISPTSNILYVNRNENEAPSLSIAFVSLFSTYVKGQV
jgi:Leishmanolysin